MKTTELVDSQKFSEIVLERAADTSLDLKTRMLALGELAAYVDDYFIEAAQQLDASSVSISSIGKSSQEIDSRQITAYLNQASQIFVDTLLPAIAEAGILLSSPEQLDADQRCWLRSTYRKQIFPLLVPLAVDPGRPFPRLRSGGLNLLVVLRDEVSGPESDNPVFALIEIPETINRWLRVPAQDLDDSSQVRWFSRELFQPGAYLWVEDTVRVVLGILFPGMILEKTYLFRVLHARTTKSSPGGQFEPRVARLDVEEAMPLPIRHWLARHLDTPMHTLVRYAPPMAMADLVELADYLPESNSGLSIWFGTLWKSLFPWA